MENKKYKILGFSAVLYGKEYMKESLLSIQDHVDIMYIAYTQTPSHGVKSSLKCPDSEEELYVIAKEVMGDKLIWESFPGFEAESLHRDMRYKYAQGKDLIISVDLDEVYEGVPAAIEFMMNQDCRYGGIKPYSYVNLWRSFDFCNRDAFSPIRFERPNADNQLQNLEVPLTVYHFSTCQSESCLRYKMSVFGHASEIDKDYLNSKYYAWTPERRHKVTHLHPASQDIWLEAEDFDKTVMPPYLKSHLNYSKYLV